MFFFSVFPLSDSTYISASGPSLNPLLIFLCYLFIQPFCYILFLPIFYSKFHTSVIWLSFIGIWVTIDIFSSGHLCIFKPILTIYSCGLFRVFLWFLVFSSAIWDDSKWTDNIWYHHHPYITQYLGSLEKSSNPKVASAEFGGYLSSVICPFF